MLNNRELRFFRTISGIAPGQEIFKQNIESPFIASSLTIEQESSSNNLLCKKKVFMSTSQRKLVEIITVAHFISVAVFYSNKLILKGRQMLF